MIPRLAPALLAVLAAAAFAATGCTRGVKAKKDYNRPLPPGQIALREVDINTLPDVHFGPGEKDAVRAALKQSQAFLAKRGAEKWYPRALVSKDEVSRSITALDNILASAASDAEVNARIKAGFRAYMSIGCDDEGTVLFTGYYTPIFDGSRTQDATHRYPLYKRPADLILNNALEVGQQQMPEGGLRPYPSAGELEASGALKGQELVWLSDPYECYLIRVQGSGKIRLPDGSIMEVGYNGTNGHEYRGIGKDLVADGKISAENLSFFTMRSYFKAHPEDVPVYTSRNPRFIFFSEVKGGPYGCLGTPVTKDVSIATDKDIFPPAGPVWAVTSTTEHQQYVGLLVDQDRGGGIRAPGRCDLYMGEGEANEQRAGGQYFEGRLYYLLVKE